ncbi:MAG: hypothetical protein ACOC2B_03805 [Sediminispirochaetaceae bacterium]
MLYSVMVAIIGAAVVFGFLILLSLLMWLIKVLFSRVSFLMSAEEKALQRSEGVVPGAGETSGAAQSNGDDKSDWLPAAVTLFLLLEEEDNECSAVPWQPSAHTQPQLWKITGEYKR